MADDVLNLPDQFDGWLETTRPGLSGIRAATATVTIPGTVAGELSAGPLRARLEARLRDAGIAVGGIDLTDPRTRDGWAHFTLNVSSHRSGFVVGGGFVLFGQLAVSREGWVRVGGRPTQAIVGLAAPAYPCVAASGDVEDAALGLVDQLAAHVIGEIAAAEQPESSLS